MSQLVLRTVFVSQFFDQVFKFSWSYQNGADDDHAEFLGERREELGGGALLGALGELAPRMLLAGAERERHRCKESAERIGAVSRNLQEN